MTTLDVVMGHELGAALRIKSETVLTDVERLGGNVLRGKLVNWAHAMVMTSGVGRSRRAWLLVPGEEEKEIVHGSFSVRGRFEVLEQANAARAAQALWHRWRRLVPVVGD